MSKVNSSLNWTICLPGIPLGLSEMIATYPSVSVELTSGRDVIQLHPWWRKYQHHSPDIWKPFSPFCTPGRFRRKRPPSPSGGSWSLPSSSHLGGRVLTPGAEFSVFTQEPEATASGKTEITRLLVKKQRTLAFLTVSKSPMTLFPGKNPPVCFISSPNERDSS